MSKYKTADAMKFNLLDVLYDSYNWNYDLIQEKRYGHQMLYILKDRLRFYLKAAICEDYGLYFFGLSQTAISVFKENKEQDKYKDYFLFICGVSEDEDGFANMIYLIPSSFIINGNIRVSLDKRYGQQEIHIEKDFNGRWVIREDEDKRDLREFCMSLWGILDFFGNFDKEEMIARDLEALKYEEEHFEGEQRERYTNYYERDPKLRVKAILLHGAKCMACDFDFEKKYGERGKGFIEIHHIKPVNELGGNTKVDPETDLSVVCSNCHRMIHRKKNKVLSLEELKKIIQ